MPRIELCLLGLGLLALVLGLAGLGGRARSLIAVGSSAVPRFATRDASELADPIAMGRSREAIEAEPASGTNATASGSTAEPDAADDETLLRVSVFDERGGSVVSGTLECLASIHSRTELDEHPYRTIHPVEGATTTVRLPARYLAALLTFSGPSHPCVMQRISELRIVDGARQRNGRYARDVSMIATRSDHGPFLRGAIQLDGASVIPDGLSILYTAWAAEAASTAPRLLPQLARVDRCARSYELELPVGSRGSLWVTGDEITPYGALIAAPDSERGELVLDLALERARSVDLQVVDRATQSPIPDLEIAVECPIVQGKAEGKIYSRAARLTAKTDSNGRARLAQIPKTGPVVVLASSPDDKEQSICLQTTGEEIWASAGATEIPVLLVAVGRSSVDGTVHGRALCNAGMPASPALDVACETAFTGSVHVCRRGPVGEDGEWTVAGIPPGDYDFWLERGARRVSDRTRVQVWSGALVGPIQLTELEPVPVTVSWKGAEPGARLDLDALDEGFDPLPEAMTLSAESGALELGLQTQRTLLATLERADRSRSTRVIQLDAVRGSGAELDFSADRLRSIVLEVEGRAVAPVVVDLVRLGDPREKAPFHTRIQLDRDGRRTRGVLPDGEYFFRCTGDDPLLVIAGIVRVSDAGSTDEVRLRCALEPGSGAEPGATLELLACDGVAVDTRVPKNLRRFDADISGPPAPASSNDTRRWCCPLGSRWSLLR